MRSIRFRLLALFVLVTTGTLALFGWYGQQQLEDRLDARFSQLQRATLSRLEIGLVEPVWNVDSNGILRNLDVEMLQDEVNAIQVFGARGELLATALRDPQGKVVKGQIIDDFEGIRVETRLSRDGLAAARFAAPDRGSLGRVVVYFSKERIGRELAADRQRWITETLVLDLVLVLALSLSLQTVFIPLRRLRNALFELAGSEGDEVHELPESGRTEFVEVIRGFNLTHRKVRQVMLRHALAVVEARKAADKTALAYRELQAAQASLVEAEKFSSLGALVAGVAHEINTPVGISLTSASTLAEASERMQLQMDAGGVRKSDFSNYLDIALESSRLILANSERAAQLIQSFKQVAVDQTNELRRTYDLRHYLDEIISSLKPALRHGSARITVQCPPGLLLDGYPGSLAQVITNLTMNSLIHGFRGRESGCIDISVESLGEDVTLKFRDDGVGIPEENLGQVFEPFFTTRRAQGGTGLGLNIAYNIMVSRFGGGLRVQSALGSGTSFILRFPRVSPRASQWSLPPQVAV